MNLSRLPPMVQIRPSLFPSQLSATIMSGLAQRNNYGRSLFERLQVTTYQPPTVQLTNCPTEQLSNRPSELPTYCLAASIQGLGSRVNLLEVQYRMHPEISAFPRNEFYGGKVRGSDMRREGRAGMSGVPLVAARIDLYGMLVR